MISESLLVLILQKPACGRLLPRSRHAGCDPESEASCQR